VASGFHCLRSFSVYLCVNTIGLVFSPPVSVPCSKKEKGITAQAAKTTPHTNQGKEPLWYWIPCGIGYRVTSSFPFAQHFHPKSPPPLVGFLSLCLCVNCVDFLPLFCDKEISQSLDYHFGSGSHSLKNAKRRRPVPVRLFPNFLPGIMTSFHA